MVKIAESAMDFRAQRIEIATGNLRAGNADFLVKLLE
jgi:hypothetical protein